MHNIQLRTDKNFMICSKKLKFRNDLHPVNKSIIDIQQF